ncbi:MAG: hypothetical protein FJX39_08950 [Alphaproteobacteria bacterium]|nr:hypothetical protein [Alphaproteobacteria bacterium]
MANRHDSKNGSSTFGDALSDSQKRSLLTLRKSLQAKKDAIIKTQREQAKAPWTQSKNNSKWRYSNIRAEDVWQAPSESSKIPPAKSERYISMPIPSFNFWELPPEIEVRDTLPSSLAQDERGFFNGLLNAGASSVSPGAGDDLFAIIGLDFGTSSTKIIVRLPYETSGPVFAIPVPHFLRFTSLPYLWRTVLWIRKDGTFIPWPEQNARHLHSLKQGIMGNHADTSIESLAATFPNLTRRCAAAAFLAYVIRYVRGWLLKNKTDYFVGRNSIWSVNIGLPAAQVNDPILLSAYRTTIAAALQMANIEGNISIDTSNMFLSDPYVQKASQSNKAADEMGVAVIPEVAAEVTGFSKSTHASPGSYLMVDVGATTLDVCAFNLQILRDGSPLNMLSAVVNPLGVESFHWFTQQGYLASDFIKQCDLSLRKTMWDAKKKLTTPLTPRWFDKSHFPIFLVGGGAQNKLHRDVLSSLNPWIRAHTNIEGINLINLPTPRNLDTPEPIQNLDRLAVAWGLSYPPDEIGPVYLPVELDDLPPPIYLDITDRYISKDQV